MTLLAIPSHPAPRFHGGNLVGLIMLVAVTSGSAGWIMVLAGNHAGGAVVGVLGLAGAVLGLLVSWRRIKGGGEGFTQHKAGGYVHMLPRGEEHFHDLAVGSCGRSCCLCHPVPGRDGELIHNRVLT